MEHKLVQTNPDADTVTECFGGDKEKYAAFVSRFARKLIVNAIDPDQDGNVNTTFLKVLGELPENDTTFGEKDSANSYFLMGLAFTTSKEKADSVGRRFNGTDIVEVMDRALRT